MAASGATGSGSRPVDTAITADLDAKARESGFSCNKEMVEMSQCQTPADYSAWKQRWKK